MKPLLGIICWVIGHRWVFTGKFTEERLHGCSHYATARTICHRCGARHQFDARGKVAWWER